MIRMEVNRGEHVEIVAEGNIPTITSEILVGIMNLKDKISASNEELGEAFIFAIKKGLDYIGDLDDESIEKGVDELVDRCIEDDDVLESVMESIPDELKADFAKRLKKRAAEKEGK